MRSNQARLAYLLLLPILGALQSFALEFEIPKIELQQNMRNLTPGLSGSFDYSDFETIKEPMMRNILSTINNMSLPDINFDGGFMRGNRLFVQQKAKSLIFEPIESQNAIRFQISDIVADMSVSNFAYTQMVIPVRGFLRVRMQGIFLRIVVKFSKLITKDGRILPQLEVTESKFELDTKKIQFDLGGNFLLSVADFLIPILRGFFRGPLEKLVTDQIRTFPAKFNTYVRDNNGFYVFGKEFPDIFPPTSPYASLTLDYQLEDEIKVFNNRMVFGINGTLFNSDKGYRAPNIRQAVMPMYDPKLPGKFQLFISNYMLESMFHAFLQKQPFLYRMRGHDLFNSVANFTTTTFEGVFPFLTKHYGRYVPSDLVIKINRVWDVDCKEDERNVTHKIGYIKMKLDLEIECIVVYPDGVNKSAGYTELFETRFSTNITQLNMTNFTVSLRNGNVTEQWVHTNYLKERPSFRSSTFIINTALMFLLDWLNEEFQPMMTFDLKDYTFGLFKYNSTYLGYNDGFLSLGMTLDFTNSSIFEEKTKKQFFLTDHMELPRDEALSLAQREELRDIDRLMGYEWRQKKRQFLESNQKRWFESDGVKYYIEEEEDDEIQMPIIDQYFEEESRIL